MADSTDGTRAVPRVRYATATPALAMGAGARIEYRLHLFGLPPCWRPVNSTWARRHHQPVRRIGGRYRSRDPKHPDRHTGAKSLAFPQRLARTNAMGGVRLILDNVSTHTTPDALDLAGTAQASPFPLHADQRVVDESDRAWFRILTHHAGRRTSFHGVKDLTHAIAEFRREWNHRAAPFAWVETADEPPPKTPGNLRRTRRGTLG
jgi:hypothetical protein